MIVILDIDETLGHSSEMEPLHSDWFPVMRYSFEKRPYVDSFLNFLLSDPYYRVGIWSAGQHDYVHEIARKLVPNTSQLEFILTRNDCMKVPKEHGVDYAKPLSKVMDMYEPELRSGELTQHDFLLVDNKYNVTPDRLRHILVPDFEGDNEDDDTLALLTQHLDTWRGQTAEWLAANWSF